MSLFLRNLLFTILHPGIVAGVIPLWIVGEKTKHVFQLTWRVSNYSGLIFFASGFIIMLICITSFAVHGRGTLSPADPTKQLVTTGLYKFSRNPMYIGVTLILIGEAIFFQSFGLGIYCLSIFVAFNVFTMLVEEPRLRRDFGSEYEIYCKNVRRWI